MDDRTIEQKIVNEEYKVWKKNVPYLYDLLFSHTLQWPSLSVQWFPDVSRDEERARTTQRLLLSTHTSGSDEECVMIAKLDFPDEFDEDMNGEEEGNGEGDMKLKVLQRVPVLAEANRVRYCPSACNILAVRSDLSDVHVYDYTRHLSHEKIAKPDMTLRGHASGGFGIAWNNMASGELASCGEDMCVCVYDILEESAVIEPRTVLKGHDAVVNDCSFSFFDRKMLASVGDDKMLMVWDAGSGEVVHSVDAHTTDVFCVKFSPVDVNAIATCSGDKSVKIWDIRKLDTAVNVLLGHSKDVLSVEWSPHSSTMLCSGGADRRVIVWDLARAGMEVSEEYRAEGPPELRFMHGGHTGTVCDVSWNPAEPYEVASVSEDNALQVWQMTKDVYD